MQRRPRTCRARAAASARCLLLAGALSLAAGCSSDNAASADLSCLSASPLPSTSGTSEQPTGPANSERPTKVLVIVLENHNVCQAEEGMPQLAAYAARYGQATRFFALTHPSLPNYLAIAGGSTFEVQNNNPPADHHLPGSSVFGQVLAAGKDVKDYAESMTRPCQTVASGRYAVKHNPWPYFTAPAERAACRRYNVPSGTPSRGALHDDIAAGTMPAFGMLIPNLCNDAHDCPVGTADRWLNGWFTQLLTGPDFRSGGLAVVVTWDEDDRHANNQILTVVLHPSLHGLKVTKRLDLYALSRALSTLVGAPPLRHAAQAPDMLAAFGLAPP
jgi:phosphatidylinositol-3-phosphatase